MKRSALFASAVLMSRAGGADASAAAPTTRGKGANDTLQTIHDLRTTHGNFSGRDVPEESLQEILQASVRAANASNLQSYSIVVVRDRPLIRQVCGYTGSRMLLYCVDFNRLRASAERLGHAYHPDNLETFVTAAVSTSFAAQTAVIAARAFGVDSLATNGIHRGDMTRVWKLLDLPENHCFPLVAIVLGYATESPDVRAGRLNAAGIVHEGKYRKLTDDEIDELTRLYDDPASHLALNDAWRSEGRAHYLDWLFGSWMARAAKPTAAETQMLRMLKRSGFVELQRG